MSLLRIFEFVARLITFGVVLIQIVERPGEGAEKKREVSEAWSEGIRKLIEDGVLPRWMEPIAVSHRFVHWLIDVLVYYANKAGFFAHRDGSEITSPAS